MIFQKYHQPFFDGDMLTLKDKNFHIQSIFHFKMIFPSFSKILEK